MRALTLITLLALPLASCAPTAVTPYTPMESVRRSPAEAERLNQQAADLMISDPAKAESLLRGALAADLYHGPAHNNLGVLFLKQGKLYEAAGEFEWAKKLLPGHPDPRLNLSVTLESAGRYDQALEYARTALEVHPGHIASIQQVTRLALLHPAKPGGRGDAAASDELVSNLREIAMRGETERWRDWARMQLVQREALGLRHQ